MNFLQYISGYIMPLMILYIIIYGALCKVKIYDEFVSGAKEAIGVVRDICPVLVGLMVATGLLRRSGVLEALVELSAPLFYGIGFPVEVVPLIMIKMFSSSAATGLLVDIYKEFGTDSYIGTISSICLASSETIFYTMTIYYSYVGVSKTRWTLPGALLTTLTGTVMAWLVCGM